MLKSKKYSCYRTCLLIAGGLDLTLNPIYGEGGDPNIPQGIEGLRDILERFFNTYDVKIIDALGEVFDPNFPETHLNTVTYDRLAE
jgi:hypothetical protein